jgi:hypothetical protein
MATHSHHAYASRADIPPSHYAAPSGITTKPARPGAPRSSVPLRLPTPTPTRATSAATPPSGKQTARPSAIAHASPSANRTPRRLDEGDTPAATSHAGRTDTYTAAATHDTARPARPGAPVRRPSAAMPARATHQRRHATSSREPRPYSRAMLPPAARQRSSQTDQRRPPSSARQRPGHYGPDKGRCTRDSATPSQPTPTSRTPAMLHDDGQGPARPDTTTGHRLGAAGSRTTTARPGRTSAPSHPPAVQALNARVAPCHRGQRHR